MARMQTIAIPSRSKTRALAVARRAAAKLIPPATVPGLEPHPSHRSRPLSFTGALASPNTELLRVAMRRSRLSLACACGGQALRVKCTGAERARFGGETFARAFVCAACHTRYVGRAKAALAWPL